MAYNFGEQLDKDSKQHNVGGNMDNFNIEPGPGNVCRVLTAGQVYATHFLGKGIKSPVCYGYEKGCPVRERDEEGNFTTRHADTSIAYVMKVLDRADGRVKTAFMKYSVVRAISELQKNPDYAFDDLPMPYDIRITYTPDQKDKKLIYATTAVPNREPVSQSVIDELNEQMVKGSPERIVERMKEKQMEADEKSGRKVSPAELQEQQEAYMKKSIADEAKKTVGDLKTKYPDEELNPEDIPF